MDIQKQGSTCPKSPFHKMSNGYVLPQGKLTPNTLFVGGIDMRVEEHEIREFFSKFGTIKEVKIITYRGGICKGYGFVYFNEDVNIQKIVEQPISFKGKKLKLGPAIMKERGIRTMPARYFSLSPLQYIYCACCSPLGGGVAQPLPVLNGGATYNQPFSYSSLPGVTFQQMPMSYSPNAYNLSYVPPPWTGDQRTQPLNQSSVDCGVQTLLSVL